MQLRQAIGCAGALVKAHAGGRTPLVVSWRLLYRCNLRCKYCHLPLIPTDELTTAQVLSTLDGLARMGTTFVNFTGGEVLLRDDIDVIVARSTGLGIATSLNTNGALVPEKLDALRSLAHLTLSLDGDEAQHDAARGKGTHRQVMEAVRVARAAGIDVTFTTVLSSVNLGAVPWLLAIAAEKQVPINFQPARLEKLGAALPDPITPPPAGYREAIALLVRAKEAGNRWIQNSLTGLHHLSRFPAPQTIPCYAGKVHVNIEPNGDLLHCSDTGRPSVVYNVVRDGLTKAMAGMHLGGCEECWCSGLVDLNFATALRMEPILNIVRTR
jgi:MoaA/NifB/PqqE/SkfB family radical SAM enzyme